MGRPIGAANSMIAAIALNHGLELVTGNTAHFHRIQQFGNPLALANRRNWHQRLLTLRLLDTPARLTPPLAVVSDKGRYRIVG
jgi:hypothetical protein